MISLIFKLQFWILLLVRTGVFLHFGELLSTTPWNIHPLQQIPTTQTLLSNPNDGDSSDGDLDNSTTETDRSSKVEEKNTSSSEEPETNQQSEEESNSEIELESEKVQTSETGQNTNVEQGESFPESATDQQSEEQSSGIVIQQDRSHLTPKDIEKILEPVLKDQLFRESEIGIHIMNVHTKEELFSYNSDAQMLPASVTKVLTAAVGFQKLGHAYRFPTDVYVVGEIDSDHVLHGDVYIIGGGDPSITTQDIWSIQQNIVDRGVFKIDGNIYFDDSLYKGPHMLPGWDKEVDIANGPSYFPYLSSLSLNRNCIAIKVRPGTQPGMPADVYLDHELSFVEIENRVRTGSASSRPRMSITRTTTEEGMLQYLMEGVIPISETKPWVYYRSIPNPSQYFADTFKSVNELTKLDVRGSFLMKQYEGNGWLHYRHASEPLWKLLTDMNKYSLNLSAESVLLQVAVKETERPSRTEDGIVYVEEYLNALGFSSEEFALVNGSGLSRSLLVPPYIVTAVLSDMYESPVYGPEYVSSLSVAGIDGTLRRRLKDNEYTAKVRGKTGSINGVYCLAAYVWTESGDVYAIAFFINQLRRSYSYARSLQDYTIQLLIEGTNQKP